MGRKDGLTSAKQPGLQSSSAQLCSWAWQ